jgi:hypothetical protein
LVTSQFFLLRFPALAFMLVRLTLTNKSGKTDMKPTGSTHRTPVTAWQREPNPGNAVLRRIQKITGELEAIQAEMHDHLTVLAAHRQARLFEDSAAVEVLNHFKAELDQLRRILWFYIEEAADKASTSADPEQQASRLERVTELARTLAPQPKAPPTLTHQESGSFFDRLNLVIDAYMQEKKPVAAETRTVQRAGPKAFS